MDHLESDLLRTFLAIADKGSFTEGAKQIYRSQSAASLQIKKLENLLESQVFARHGKGVCLSPTGERLLPVAQHIINQLDATLHRLKPSVISGRIRMGIPDEFGDLTLPHIIAHFARTHPNIELEIECGYSANFGNALQKGKLDIAVFDVETPNARQILLKHQQIQWVCNRKSPLYQATPVPIALYKADCWWRTVALDALDRAGIEYKIVYISESNAGIMAAIDAGVAIGLLGDAAMKPSYQALTPAEGFPILPSTNLVLDYHPDIDPTLSSPILDAIVSGFRHVLDPIKPADA